MNPRILHVVLSALLVGCIHYSHFDEVRYSNMADRLEYQGFSFDRPPNRQWYFLQSEEFATSVTLRRKILTVDTTHTFYAIVALGGIERSPVTHGDFGSLARITRQEAPYEIRPVSYEQRLTTRQSQWCIRFEASYLALGAPVSPDRDLSMVLRGYRCLHPTWPNATLDFWYSERGLPDEIDQDLWAEGEAFLDGVRIDTAPGAPAA